MCGHEIISSNPPLFSVSSSKYHSKATSARYLMAMAGMRVLVLTALAVGLLAVAVSGARAPLTIVCGGGGGSEWSGTAMKVAIGLVPTDGGATGGAGAAGQQRKGARILAAETFAHHAPLPDLSCHIRL
ncbi:unnamed protein product [Closterium sp. NIES-54]